MKTLCKIGQKHFIVCPVVSTIQPKNIFMLIYITLKMSAVVKMCEKRGIQNCPLQKCITIERITVILANRSRVTIIEPRVQDNRCALVISPVVS